MKRMKKLLAGILALSMSMSMLTMTAFATDLEGGEAETVTVKSSAPAIDQTLKGSITIHKYVQQTFEEGKGWPNGSTGEVLEAPTGAHPLAGVTFTVYKIAGTQAVLDYYSGDSEKAEAAGIPTQEELFDPNDAGEYMSRTDLVCIKDSETKKWKINDYYEKKGTYKDDPIVEINHFTTDANGKAEFKNLDVGIYVVIETDSPGAVVTPADPFLVSIPLTVNHMEEGNVTNSEWIYDVHAYPKNTTVVSGDVKIVKTGRIAGTNGFNRLSDVKFRLDKYETTKDENGNSSGSWVPVMKTTDKYGQDIPVGTNGVITSSPVGVVSVTSLSPGKYRFVEIQTVDGYILPDNGAWYFSIDDSGELDWETAMTMNEGECGPYTKNFVYATTWFEEAKVSEEDGQPSSGHDVIGGIPNAINEKPDIDKKVAPKTAPDSYTQKEADYSVDDKIPYQLTISLPAVLCNPWETGNWNGITISDNPSNMKDDKDSIKIWINNGEITEESKNDYVNSIEEDGNGFIIEFNPEKLFYDTYSESEGMYGIEDVTIKIEYTATLLESASVTSIEGNRNEATLEYSSTAKGQGISKITDRTVVYSGEIDVLKHIGDSTKTGLDGVEFELYEQITGKTQADVKDGKITVAGVEKTVAADASAKGLTPANVYVKIGTYTTVDDGKIRVRGLSNGTYWLVETKTAENYNLLESPVQVDLSLGYKTVMKDNSAEQKWTCTEIRDADGKITGYILDKNEITSTTTTGTVDEDEKITEKASQIVTIDEQYFGVSKEIINRQGFTLPTTGGMGTFLFTFVGIAMMSAAVILFITSKKKEVK